MPGAIGSPLCAELNRIANNGVYPDRDDFLEEQGAANVWAGTTGQGLLGALNYIVDPSRTENNFSDLTKVCNELAGTTGLSDVDALRTIGHAAEVLLRGTTPQSAAFYTDAATPRYNYPGYLTMSGVDGDYISTPDAAALDITGAIDLQVKLMLPVVPPVKATTTLIQKGTTSNLSYSLFMDNTGYLAILISSSGTAWDVSAYSTAIVSFPANTAKWVRATFTPNNGSGSRETKFFTSDDGTTWTQLGTTVTGASMSSLFSGNAQVGIAGSSTGTTSLLGRFYRAIIKNGIDGTTVLDVNAETNVTSATYDQFTATTGQLCTINGQNTLTNAGNAGSLLPVTVGSSLAADSNDAKFLAHTGTNYVYLPGVGFNNLVIPDSAELDITGDLDLRAYVALDDWTPATGPTFIAKDDSAGTQRSFSFQMNSSGRLFFSWSSNGTSYTATQSTVSVTPADGAPLWVRATFDVDNGASGNDVKFYTSTDGSTWTQLGTTVTTAGVTSIFAGTGQVTLGTTANTGAALVGKYYRAQIFNGIDGTKVLDVDTSVITSGADTYVVPTTYTGQAGAYFTGSGLSLNGVAGNYVSTPDSTALDITGDLDVQVKVAMTDWTPGNSSVLLDKWGAAGQRSYSFYLLTTGLLYLSWTADGTTEIAKASTVATGITDGSTKWVRVTLDVNNGASGNDVKFWTSDDGTTWTQLGSTVTTAGTTSIFNSTTEVKIGQGLNSTAFNANGTFYEAIVKSGIDGYAVFDADFTQVSANALRMTESSINKAVVTLNTTRYATINRSTSGRKTVAVTQPTWLFGTDDYMEVNNRYMAHSTSDENYVYLSGNTGNSMTVADTPPLDITGDLDLQVKVALDDWTPAANSALLYKWDNAGASAAYGLRVNATTGRLILLWTENGSTVKTATSTVAPTVTDGATLWVRATLDVDNGASGNTTTFYTSTDGTNWTQLGIPLVSAGVTSIYSGTGQVEIGGFAGGLSPSKGKFYRAIIKNGIDGTTVLDANAAVITLPSQTTFTDSSSNAYTVTINKSGVGTFVSTGNYLYLPGVDSNNASTPDAAALDITGDIDLRFKVAMDDWTPSVSPYFISKSSSGAGNYSYWMALNTTGTLVLGWSNNGTAIISRNSTVAPTVADGATLWIRAVLDVDNGAAGHDVIFYTSTDGLTWTQLGATVTTAGTTSIYSGTSQLQVGTFSSAGAARGKFFRAQVYNGIGGTIVFDANFEGSITSLNQASFTESSSNAATVTINRSGSAYRSAGVIDAGYLYPGATNTFAVSAIGHFELSATDSLTAIAVVRQWNTPTSFGRYFSKNIPGNSAFWAFMSNGTTANTWWAINSGSGEPLGQGTGNNTSIPYTIGGLSVLGFRLDRTASDIRSIVNSTISSGISTSSVGAISSPSSFRIGNSGGTNYQDAEIVAVAVFRSVLTPKNISDINNYYQNRD